MDVDPVHSSGDVWDIFGNICCLIQNFLLESKQVRESSVKKFNFNRVVKKNHSSENGIVKKESEKLLGIVLCFCDLLLNERIQIIVSYTFHLGE